MTEAAAPAPVQKPPANHAVSVTVGGDTVTTNADSEENVRALLEGDEEAEGDVKKAASELGKRGGKASAEKRAAEKDAEKPDTEDEDGEEAKAKDTDDEEEKESKGKKKGDPRHDPVARMKQATRQASEAKRELAAERASREELEARIARLERGEQPASVSPRQPGNGKPDPNAEPREEDFETYKEYVKAQSRFEVRQELAEERERARQEAQAAEHGKAIKTAIDNLLEGTDKLGQEDPEAAERVAEVAAQLVPSFGLPPGVKPTAPNFAADEILTSKSGAPRIMLWLSEHPDALQRLATLKDPRDALREVARIDARLDSASPGQPAPKAKTAVSQAPPPIRPVTGVPAATDSDDLTGDLSYDEFAARKRAQLIRERKAQLGR